jgi:hypothetical protein
LGALQPRSALVPVDTDLPAQRVAADHVPRADEHQHRDLQEAGRREANAFQLRMQLAI